MSDKHNPLIGAPKPRYTTPPVDKDLGYAATKFQSSTPSILAVPDPISLPNGKNAQTDVTTGANNQQLNTDNLPATSQNKPAAKSPTPALDQDVCDEIDKIINVPGYVPTVNGGVTIIGGSTNGNAGQLVNVNSGLPGSGDAS